MIEKWETRKKVGYNLAKINNYPCNSNKTSKEVDIGTPKLRDIFKRNNLQMLQVACHIRDFFLEAYAFFEDMLEKADKFNNSDLFTDITVGYSTEN